MDGNLIRFVSRPWTAAILVLAIALLVYGAVGSARMRRTQRDVVAVSEAGVDGPSQTPDHENQDSTPSTGSNEESNEQQEEDR